jgi:hypothetical protein
MVVVGEEAQLLGLSLAVVEGDGALPASLLVGIEFAEVSDDALAWTGLSADRFDKGEIGKGLTGHGPAIASEKHGHLLAKHHGQEVTRESRELLSTTWRIKAGDDFPLL